MSIRSRRLNRYRQSHFPDDISRVHGANITGDWSLISMPFAQFYGALHTISTFDTGTTELPTSLNAHILLEVVCELQLFFYCRIK